jgi:hypothetical protein
MRQPVRQHRALCAMPSGCADVDAVRPDGGCVCGSGRRVDAENHDHDCGHKDRAYHGTCAQPATKCVGIFRPHLDESPIFPLGHCRSPVGWRWNGTENTEPAGSPHFTLPLPLGGAPDALVHTGAAGRRCAQVDRTDASQVKVTASDRMVTPIQSLRLPSSDGCLRGTMSISPATAQAIVVVRACVRVYRGAGPRLEPHPLGGIVMQQQDCMRIATARSSDRSLRTRSCRPSKGGDWI